MDALIGHYVPDDDVALLALQVKLEAAGRSNRPLPRCQCVGCSFRSVSLAIPPQSGLPVISSMDV